MEYEKEVVLSIRHCVEMYEQQRLFDDNIADEDYIPLEATLANSHVCLGSRQRGVKLLSYEQILRETLEFPDFGDSLARFLRDYALMEIYGLEFLGDGFEGHQNCIYWHKVIFVSSTPFVEF